MIRVLQQTGMDWFQVCCYDWFGVMIELRRILYTSMERMDSCRVISILEYVFFPMTDTITSVFHHSSSISKNERDKRGVHLPYSHRLIETNTTVIPSSPTCARNSRYPLSLSESGIYQYVPSFSIYQCTIS